MKLIGVLSIEGGLYCKKEILGKTFDAIIGGFVVKVFFPQLCEENGKKVGSDNPLSPPQHEQKLVVEKWGCVLEYPSYNSIVEQVLIEIEVNDIEHVQFVYDDVLRWTYAVIDFCELSTKRHYKLKSKFKVNNKNLKLFYNNDLVSDHLYGEMTLSFPNDSMYVDINQIENSFEYASSEKKLLLEYQMLLSSYEAVLNEEYRKAILDSCCAVEIVLTNLIEKFCIEKGIEKNILLDKYRTLGEKFKLAIKIDKQFPKIDTKEKIVDVRNNMIHLKDIFPSEEETKTLIENVEVIIHHYSKEYY